MRKIMVNLTSALTAAALILTLLGASLNFSGNACAFSAYSEQTLDIFTNKSTSSERLVIPGGEPFGVKLKADGVMVIELESKSSAAARCGFKEGDSILSVDGVNVFSTSEIAKAIRNCDGRTLAFKIRRDGEQMTLKLTPEVSGGSYHAGMWLRDSSAGIGTLTFYDPMTGIFGGLGHPVCDADTGQIIDVREGTAEAAVIYGYEKSQDGRPGALLGNFSGESSIGKITKNDRCGVFGVLGASPSHKEAIPIAKKSEIREGKATIYTTIDGSTPQQFEVRIEEIKLNDSEGKNLVIRITDSELLAKTGGILQGMSGSPIIQGGKLIGAVTHVFVNSPDMGYGIFAEEMDANRN